MNLYRIFQPQFITFEYWDDYGNQYADIVEGTPFVDRPYTEAEALDALRTERTRRLEACDYTQLPDVGIEPDTVALWRTYRQELRDITDGLVWNVTQWPAKP